MKTDQIKKIPVVELFGPVIQGEGALCGKVSYFLRSGGCSFRCNWCDSLHAVLPKEIRKRVELLTPSEIISKIWALAPESALRRPCWVTLSGGDPVMHDLGEVVVTLKREGFFVAVETQGVLWSDWLEYCDLVTASPKGPSSGMADKFDLPMLQKYAVRLADKLVLKFVAFNSEDLDWIEKIRAKFKGVECFLSSGTPQGGEFSRDRVLDQYGLLAAEVLRRPQLHDVTVLPQLHSLVWGRELGR